MKIDKMQRKIALMENKKTHFESQFLFLRSHNGFRKSKLHVLMAETGAGKSTLVRSIIYDLLPSIPKDKKILLVLSEETELDYAIEIELSGFPDTDLDRLEIISETEYKSEDDVRQALIHKLSSDSSISFLLYDNLTTSMMYMDKGPTIQPMRSRWLKSMCEFYGIPFLIIVHANNTDKKRKSLLDMNCIRGNRMIMMIAEFVYILNAVNVSDKSYRVIQLCKHRGQNVNGTFFSLRFGKRHRVYIDDRKIDYEELKLLMKEKNEY